MTIKIRFHGETATIRWKNPMEKQFLKNQLTLFRDAMGGKVQILLRDENGKEIPKMQMPMRPTMLSGGIMASGAVAPVSGPNFVKAAKEGIYTTYASGEVNQRLAETPSVVVKLDKPA
jgi:hypothetical protein